MSSEGRFGQRIVVFLSKVSARAGKSDIFWSRQRRGHRRGRASRMHRSRAFPHREDPGSTARLIFPLVQRSHTRQRTALTLYSLGPWRHGCLHGVLPAAIQHAASKLHMKNTSSLRPYGCCSTATILCLFTAPMRASHLDPLNKNRGVLNSGSLGFSQVNTWHTGDA